MYTDKGTFIRDYEHDMKKNTYMKVFECSYSTAVTLLP